MRQPPGEKARYSSSGANPPKPKCRRSYPNIETKITRLLCSHPSPLGATKTNTPFLGSGCFSRANEELRKRGWEEVDWRVDGDLSNGI